MDTKSWTLLYIPGHQYLSCSFSNVAHVPWCRVEARRSTRQIAWCVRAEPLRFWTRRVKIRRRKGRVGSRAESTSIVTSGFSSLPVKIKPLYRSTNVTKLSVRTQVGKPSERAFQPAIERQKQTSELRIMKKIPYRATPQTHTQKERQDRKSLISLRKKNPLQDRNPWLLYPPLMIIILSSYTIWISLHVGHVAHPTRSMCMCAI